MLIIVIEKKEEKCFNTMKVQCNKMIRAYMRGKFAGVANICTVVLIYRHIASNTCNFACQLDVLEGLKNMIRPKRKMTRQRANAAYNDNMQHKGN